MESVEIDKLVFICKGSFDPYIEMIDVSTPTDPIFMQDTSLKRIPI
jgi:hypothetical protein